MIRYQIFENDVTTAGGIVQRHTGGGKSFIWHNRLASNIGDKIKCPKCGSVGYIEAAGMRRSFDNHKDIPALDGDLCICKCNPPPVLKHSQTSFRHNVAGGIVINVPKNPLNVSAPSLQQNLNNSLVDDKDQGNSYYKWWWGKLESTNPKTIRQEKQPFKDTFKEMHHQYAYGTHFEEYEIDPKAWDGDIIINEHLSSMIQNSVDNNWDLGKALAKLSNGQSIDKMVWDKLNFGGNYFSTIFTKQWAHGRWAAIATGKLTKLGVDANGKADFQFTGYLTIKEDTYSWNADNEKFLNNVGIVVMGEIVRAGTGRKRASEVYKSKGYEMPTKYVRKFHFDYYKKGTKIPKH